MDKIIVIGSSGHARSVIDVILVQRRYKIVGILDCYETVGVDKNGFRIIGKVEDIQKVMCEYKTMNVVIAVGDNYDRIMIRDKILKINKSIHFPTIIHSGSIVSKQTTIGRGTVIMPGAIINSNVVVGEFCILNSNSVLEHDSVIKDGSSLGPSSTVGGGSTIGYSTAICIGAVVKHSVEIGDNCVIGASSLVLKSIPNNKLAYGIPIKICEDRKAYDRYL